MSNNHNWKLVAQHIQDAQIKLRAIYDEMGITDDYKAIYDEQACSHITELLNDMISEWEQKKKTLLLDIQELMQQANTLCKELDTNNIFTGYEDLPLKNVEKSLRRQVEDLLKLKEQRLAYFRELKEQEYDICKKLGIQTMNLETPVPSEKELEQLKLYISDIESEKNRAENIANELRLSIMRNMDLLGIVPSTPFENLVCNNYEDFVYTTSNLSKLRELRNELEGELEQTKQRVDSMKQDLMALWKHLGEPEDIYKSFLATHAGFSSATINALKGEIKRCKEKRMENIAKYVSKVREDLVELWTLCKFSEEQKKEFRAFESHTYTEDLLTLHEMEANRLKLFYEENRIIFDVLNERDSLWMKMKELQQRADDPDRFHNRGGQLLAEERERKVIQKKLPKIEERLQDLVKEYESKYGKTFTVHGMPLEEFLLQSWESYKTEKETIKKARREAKETNKAIKKTPLSTSKKLPSMSTRHTPLSTSKRKLPFDISPNKSVKRRIVSAEKNHPTLCASKVRRSGKVARRLLNRSLNKSAKKKRSLSETTNTNATDTTYGQFQEHLEQRDELRSSLLITENVLSLANVTQANTPLKTPIKTPAKPLRRNLSTVTTPIRTPRTPSRPLLKSLTAASTPSNSSRNPNSSQKPPRSPRNVQTTRLVTAPNNLPIIF